MVVEYTTLGGEVVGLILSGCTSEQKAQQRSSDVLGNCSSGVLAMF